LTIASPDELLIVSDLHLGVSVGDRGVALASFVRDATDAGIQRLVLLGDSLDLPTHVSGLGGDATDRWVTAAADAVERIADAQPQAFDAIAQFIARGGRLELIAGNHDVALHLRVVRTALVDRLGGRRAAVGWHPWALHLPGLLWAEHGSQHHDLHAIPEWLSPPATRSTWGLPPGRAIEALSIAARDRRPSRALLEAAAALAADAFASAAARPALARTRRAYRARELPACASALELPLSSLVAVDRLSETDLWAIAARLMRRRLERDSELPASFLGPAAQRVHAILAAVGREVRIYAFGHTHAPTVMALSPAASGAWFANAGSWAGLRPAALDARIGVGRYPFLRISVADRPDPIIELELWNAARERVEPFPA